MISDAEIAELRRADLASGLSELAVVAFGATPDIAVRSGFTGAWRALKHSTSQGVLSVLSDPRTGAWVQLGRRLVRDDHPFLAPDGAWADHLADFRRLRWTTPTAELRKVGGFEILAEGDLPSQVLPPGHLPIRREDTISEEWRSLLTACRNALAGSPVDEAFVDRFVLALAPGCEWAEDVHFSTSSADAPGVVFLSWSPRLESVVEALVHEAGHQWLYALDSAQPVLRGSRSCRPAVLQSPWRTDTRPLDGLLHGVVSFTRVYSWWGRVGSRDDCTFDRAWLNDRQDRVREQVAAAFGVLTAHASYLTEQGTAVLEDIGHVVGLEVTPPLASRELIELPPLLFFDLATPTGRAALLELDGLRAHDLARCSATGPLSQNLVDVERAWQRGEVVGIERAIRNVLSLELKNLLAWRRLGECFRRRGDLEDGAQLLLAEIPWETSVGRTWLRAKAP